jgi:hypothetical protein
MLYPDGVTPKDNEMFNQLTSELITFIFDEYALTKLCMP